MAEYMHLTGSEDVARAGYNIQSAANDMCRAASTIENAVHQLHQLQQLTETSITVKREEQWCEVPGHNPVRYHGAHVMDNQVWALVELADGSLVQFRTVDVMMIR